jgi:UDP-N-acetylmuramoylalanine--D-glutamate ligase
MENYIKSKARIFEYQDENDYFVVNFDDKQVYEVVPNCKARIVPFSRLSELKFGVFVKNNKITIADENRTLIEICGIDELVVIGTHNLENALASVAIAYFAGVSISAIAKTLRTFSGVEHRVELCGEINGVKFINDSKGTNVDSSVRAIEAIEGNIILIAGGYDKKVEFDELFDAFLGKVKHVMLLGTTAKKLQETAERKGFYYNVILDNMEQCVQKAFELAEPGDTILLSPACSSHDMYSNFEERGIHFKNCVSKVGELNG